MKYSFQLLLLFAFYIFENRRDLEMQIFLHPMLLKFLIMGFLLTTTIGFLFTIVLGIQLTISILLTAIAKKGPHTFFMFSEKGKRRCKFVRQSDVPRMKKAAERYKKTREAIKRLKSIHLLIPVNPATDSDSIRPPVGAKRRWLFIIPPSDRNGSRMTYVFS